MESFLGIFNPVAGGGRGKRLLPGILKRLLEGGVHVQVVPTKGPGDATRIARKAYAEGERYFIAMGGDGTSFEVLNGIFPLKSDLATDRPLLGFLPMGTGNSFLREFTTEGLEYGIRALIEGRQRPCDVIRVRHRDGYLYFLNIFSFGFVADVGATRNKRFHGLGEAGYVLGVLKELTGLKKRRFPLRVNDTDELDEPATFISINNSKFTGGKMMMAPSADTGDGKADLIHVGEMGRFRLLRAFPKIFKGTHVRLPNVTARKVESVDFQFAEEIDVMVDG